jgi:hypothetical protein
VHSRSKGLVVDAGRVDVEDLLVEPPLGRADLPDALEQLVEVVAMTWSGRILEPLVVHGEALHQVLAEQCRRPLPELRASVASDAEADSEDRVEVVVTQAPCDLSAAFLSNL